MRCAIHACEMAVQEMRLWCVRVSLKMMFGQRFMLAISDAAVNGLKHGSCHLARALIHGSKNVALVLWKKAICWPLIQTSFQPMAIVVISRAHGW